ncbi:Fic family protein [Oscillospiraceae bacterium OttesenSCG-928-F05]|nr:Fic family protein [Oscillospiraceae bacterium OttesenSCG-928-F05]
MRTFDYANTAPKLFTPEVVNLIAAIHENKGKQDLFIEAKPDVLSSLLDIAKIQSTEASNKIEGIVTTEARLKEIVQQKAVPRSRSEKGIAGYRDVLTTIHENYDYITPRANVVLQLHRDLYAYSPTSIGGTYKNADNIIQETDVQGNKRVRFQPLPAFETPEAMEHLCDTFIEEVNRGEIDPLLLIPMFVLDFLCIHPFNDGNGRMSRLLTLLLLYRSGYIAGKYISIEMLIEKTKDTYYDVLQQSGIGWHETTNDYLPFVEYYLGIILNAYREFSSRVELLTTKGLSKTDRVRAVIENKVGKITKKEIMELCPDISQTTVEKALSDLVKHGTILKIGDGRYTQYVLNRK